MKRATLLIIFLILHTVSSIAQEWHTDFNTAKQIASKEKKPIILVFQGSDWCAPCIKLDKQIWSTNEFKKYAEEKYVMLQADFPRRKKNKLSEKQTKENALLAEKYNKNGHFPLVVVLNAKGDILGETGYKKTTVASYIATINSFLK